MSKPLLSLKNASLAFGTKVIFEDLNLHLYDGDKICLVGKNGEGKSTLLKILNNNIEPDYGELWQMPGIKISYLPQELKSDDIKTVSEFVLDNAYRADDREHKQYLADIVLTPLQLNKSTKLSELSGGQLRKANLAKALIDEPDILLLDEPTNHLDITTIEWLEKYLQSFKGTILCISHDRTFLKNISNKTFWIDRNQLRINNKGYESFEEWSIAVYEDEKRSLNKLSKKLSEEEEWKIAGVTARRKRNQKRLADLYILREKLKAHQTLLNKRKQSITLDEITPVSRSKFVAEFHNICFSANGKKIINNLSLRIMRGDKIGIIGPNGCGKTTLLKLLTKELEPDEGTIKSGKNIDITYYDQHRSNLNYDDTLWETLCGNGGDHVTVGEHCLHVVTYLKNFLFDPKNAKDKVGTLSGGQANRLMLAKILAAPGTLLILDEPTNDLDMDTLDMMQEILSEYKGTLIIVSHDRDFLDRIVTKTLVFDQNGNITEYFGSYLEYQKENSLTIPKVDKKLKSPKKNSQYKKTIIKTPYHIKRELELLPNKIAELESDISEIEAILSDPLFFQNNQKEFNNLSQKLRDKKIELEQAWERWGELEK